MGVHLKIIFILGKLIGFFPFSYGDENGIFEELTLNRKSFQFAYFCFVLAFNCINAIFYVFVFVSTILWDDISAAICIPVIGNLNFIKTLQRIKSKQLSSTEKVTSGKDTSDF
jgi:hypothetical protein